jgi:DNA polymerase I-like protein with 3'-5' exonuclease and polymerase domains
MIPVFLDFETYYDRDYSLKKMSVQEYIFDPRFKVHGVGVAIGRNPPRWFKEPYITPLLQRMVPGNVAVGHNISGFDAAILEWHYKLKPRFIIDTLAMSRALIGERLRSHSLDSIAKYMLGREKGHYLASTMGQYNLTPEQDRQLGEYCATNPDSDVNLCRSIFYALISIMPKLELPVADMVARMYLEPKLYLDNQMLIQYHSEVVARKLIALDEAGIVDAKELRSNPQFAEALQRLGVIPPMKTSPTTGQPAYAFAKTDEGMQALEEHPDDRVQALVAARLEVKSTLAETRAMSFINASRYGEFPIGYNYSGAQTTHRLSGANGMNLQNLPRGGVLRKSIMAPTDSVLAVGDLGQIECRITLALAIHLYIQRNKDNPHLSQTLHDLPEYQALQTLANGGDLYSEFGSYIYQTTITKETHPLERQIAKSAVLGLGFGMGKDKFIDYCRQMGIEITDELAGYIVKLYRSRYMQVPQLWKYLNDSFRDFCRRGEPIQLFNEPNVTIEFAKHPKVLIHGHVTAWQLDPSIGLVGALRVKYPNLLYHESSRQFTYERSGGTTHIFAGKFVENLVQYLARQIIMEQTVRVNRFYPVVMHSHDEMTTIAKEEQAEECTSKMKEIMEERVNWWPSLPLTAEVTTAYRYGEAK